MNELEIQLTERLHRRAAKAVPRFDLAGVVADAQANSGTLRSGVDGQPRRVLAVAASCLLVAAAAAATVVHVSRSDTTSYSPGSEPAAATAPPNSGPTRRIFVAGDAMAPTLRDGDIITVALRLDPSHLPERFAIVALTRTDDGATPRMLVKRVIGLPGETIAFDDCHVIVNGVRIDERYVDLAQQQSDGCGANQPELLVPAGTVFVLGDNRGRSSDSRAFGPVPLATISGTMTTTTTP